MTFVGNHQSVASFRMTFGSPRSETHDCLSKSSTNQSSTSLLASITDCALRCSHPMLLTFSQFTNLQTNTYINPMTPTFTVTSSETMSSTDGYSTPVSCIEDQESPVPTPPTPRYRKRMIGVKRLPSGLAMPDLDFDDGMMDARGHHAIPVFDLKPRFQMRAPFSSSSSRTPLFSRADIEARVDSISNKRPRHDRCAMRASLAHRTARTMPTRSDSCDW
jgi:hypothetical protein